MADAAGSGRGPLVSVVVATHDRPELLARLLDAIAAQTLARTHDDAFELIVVDDASAPETGVLLTERERTGDLPLRTIRREASGGPAGARNTGWREARAPLVAFTDDDCEPAPRWLEELVEASRLSPDSFLQGPTSPSPRDAPGPFTRTISVSELGPWFPMSNMALPRELLERLGGFDESLPRGEDTDLAWRAMELGAEASWVEGALVEHAIVEAGPLGLLRVAWAWAPAARNVGRHPGLRKHLYLGFFWKRQHALLLLALAAAALSARPGATRLSRLAAALLAAPYLRDVRARAIASGAGQAAVAFHILHDSVELAAMARGSIAARTIAL